MTDLYTPSPAPEANETGATPIGDPIPPAGQRCFTLTQSVRSLLRMPVSFSGRVARSEYWWNVLFLAAVTAPLYLVHQLAVTVGAPTPVALSLAAVGGIVCAASFGIQIGLGARRLHDTNRSGWLQLLYLVPVAGWIALLVLKVSPGTPGVNRHGPMPLPSDDRQSAGVVTLTVVGLAATVTLRVMVVVASVGWGAVG
ncbi:MAG: DUF805 domain-containing protein [Candidatus Nanopelagicales bacterium]